MSNLKLIKLRVKKDIGGNWHHQYLCGCGAYFVCRGAAVNYGTTTSCGCFARRLASARVTGNTYNLKHGLSESREYVSWSNMINRCTNENADNYAYYGGRGIRICNRWRKSFKAFYEDMGPRPKQTSLDRIDSNGNYEPKNCRWATGKVQRANRRK